MPKTLSRLVLTTALLTGLAACCSEPINKQKLIYEPHYWQRVEASSAIYLRGPKAQQMLNRDISRCVTEVRELKRLGAIRHVTPGEIDEYGLVPDPETPEGAMLDWDSPTRDGYLRAEHLEYHDFETCMMERGWERIDGVPYDIADESREDYIDAIVGEHYPTRQREREFYVDEFGIEDAQGGY